MNNKLAIILASALVGILLIVMFLLPNPDPWFLTYDSEDKTGYGSYVLAEMLRLEANDTLVQVDSSMIDQVPIEKVQAGDNMIFTGKNMYLDSSEIVYLNQFASKGGHVFCLAQSIPKELVDTFLWGNNGFTVNEFFLGESGFTFNSIIRDSAVMHLETPDYEALTDTSQYKYVIRGEFSTHAWVVFAGNVDLDSYEFEHIGWLDDAHMNSFCVKVGEGTMSFHTNPEIFANYYLLNSKNQDYTSTYFAQLGEGTFYWNTANRKRKIGQSSNNPELPGALDYLMSKPALRNAWYILLLASLLYVLFGARRRQKQIPIRTPKENTSIEYSEAIAHLYLQEQNHKKIALLKIDLFKSFLREHYGIQISREQEDDEQLRKTLTIKSSIELDEIVHLFKCFHEIRIAFKMKDELLIELHQRLEHFYTNCK